MSRVLRHRLCPGGPEITVRVIRSAQRKRTIALQLAPDRRVTLRAPMGTKREKLTEVLRMKTAWLEQRLSDAWGEIPPPNPPREFVAGETFHFLGRQCRLKLSVGTAVDKVQLEGGLLHVCSRKMKPLSGSQVRGRLKAWFQVQAKEFLSARVTRWVSRISVGVVPRVVVADQSRRWASCGSGAILRLNWRLMSAPVSLVDYVIVHELCHIRHPNHSRGFWAELERIMPNYPAAMHQLVVKGPDYVF